jgi:hypothetical protein
MELVVSSRVEEVELGRWVSGAGRPGGPSWQVLVCKSRAL